MSTAPSGPPQVPTSAAAAARARFVSIVQRESALVALVVLCVIAAVRYEAFPTPENLWNVLRQNSMVGLVSLGMTFVILSGGIDLSVGAMLAIGGVVGAVLSPYGSVAAVAGAVAVTAVLGLLNGVLITRARIQPFITTLAIGIAARGVLLAATQEQTIRLAPGAVALKWLGRGWVGPFPVPVLLLFAAFGLGWLVLAHTRFGRHVYAVGDNDEAARLMGLDVPGVTLRVYALSAALAGFAGVMLAARLNAGQPVAGTGWELTAITAVVVGGTLLSGGQGTAGGTLVGLLLLGVIYNVFNLEGTLTSYWQWVLRGVFLLVVVVVQKRLMDRS